MSLSPNGSTPNDETLMIRVQNGDTDAFAELYDRHAARAFRVAEALCHDTGRAEAAVQEGFLAIWDSRTHFSPKNGSFKVWSMRIVKNRAIDSYPTDATHSRLQPTETQAEQPDALLTSLRGLPAAQAEVIALAFFGELSHSEIAALLYLPSDTVKGRMRLGLEKLRERRGALT